MAEACYKGDKNGTGKFDCKFEKSKTEGELEEKAGTGSMSSKKEREEGEGNKDKKGGDEEGSGTDKQAN